MKVKASKKEFNGCKVLKISYCHAQRLLSCVEPFAYSGGAYGWDCDYYQIGNTIVCTGYRPIGSQVDYDLISEYEKKATNLKIDWMKETRLQKRYKLLLKFIKKALEENKK